MAFLLVLGALFLMSRADKHDLRSEADGYLENSDRFVYLVAKKGKAGKLVIEDAGAKETKEIKVDKELMVGFFDGEDRMNSYWYKPDLTAEWKKNYVIYPQLDSYEHNGRLVLAFARLVLVIDLDKEQVVESLALVEPGHRVVANSFWFLEKEGMPLVVVESGWEGTKTFEAIVDLSGEKARVENVSMLDKCSFDVFNLRNIQWAENGLVMTLYDHVPVGFEVRDIIGSFDANSSSRQEIERMERLAEARLVGKYGQVKCILAPGIIEDECYAVKDLAEYVYEVDKGFRRIKE